MAPKDHLIQKLRELCAANGGPESVAIEISASAENLKQILAGTKLPKTGHARGVGPNLQNKLEMRYPGWAQIGLASSRASSAIQPAAFSGPSVLQDLQTMPDREREKLVADIHERAENYRAFLRETMARMRQAGDAAATKAAVEQPSAGPAPAEAEVAPALNVVNAPFGAKPRSGARRQTTLKTPGPIGRTAAQPATTEKAKGKK